MRSVLVRNRILALLAFALPFIWFALPSRATFVSATVIELQLVRDTAGVVTGISFILLLRDDATPEVKRCSYVISGNEFTTLPVSAVPKKAALVAIAKREGHICFDAWVTERAARAQTPIVRDPLTDLGVTSFSSFTGEAAPLPTPTP